MKSTIRVLCVVLAVTLPAAVALHGAWNLGTRVLSYKQVQVDRTRSREIQAESRALSSRVSQDIEAIKARAMAIDLNRKNAKSDSSILSVAEVGSNLNITRVATQSSTVTHDLLIEAAKKINKNNIQNHYTDAFSVGTRYLAVALSAPSTSKAAYLLAIVDPNTALPSVRDWMANSEGPAMRGSLVSSDGRIVAASDGTGLGKDISKTVLFSSMLAPTFRNERTGGSQIIKQGNATPNEVAYRKLQGLSFTVITERPENNAWFTPPSLARTAAEQGVFLILALAASIALVYKAFAQPNTTNKAAEAPILAAPELALPIAALTEVQQLRSDKANLARELQEFRSNSANEIRHSNETNDEISVSLGETGEAEGTGKNPI